MLSYSRLTTWPSLDFADTVFYQREAVTNNQFDGWVGRSFELGPRQNLNITLKYLQNDFEKRPPVERNYNVRLHDRQAILSSVSFSKLNFFKARNIYAFNITEDIPVGYLLALTVGQDHAEFETRDYLGLLVTFARYLNIGYLYFSLRSSRFIGESVEDRILNIRSRYFSPLFDLGSLSNRWFFRFQYLEGHNLSIPLTFNLAENNRVRDLEGNYLQGSELLNLSLESVFFLPNSLLGFRLAPYVFSDLGFIRDNRVPSIEPRVFYNLGTGIRLRNEHLVFDTFDLRVSYFPDDPQGRHQFFFNLSLSTPIVPESFNVIEPRFQGLE
jgi:hypothetical protein